MVNLDLDTLKIFESYINKDYALVFYGKKEFTWQIIYKENLSSIQTYDFYKIINPQNSVLISNIYMFNHLTDAIIFYLSKGFEFFENSIITISDIHSINYIYEYISKIAVNKKKKIKLNFFHRENKYDLFVLYIKLLNRNIEYVINEDEQKPILIYYNELPFKIDFKQIKMFNKIANINDRDFYIKNIFLKPKNINIRLNW